MFNKQITGFYPLFCFARLITLAISVTLIKISLSVIRWFVRLSTNYVKLFLNSDIINIQFETSNKVGLGDKIIPQMEGRRINSMFCLSSTKN